MAQEPTGFGGWQCGQVLTDGLHSFTVIDWPNLGAHWPLEDIAGAIASFDDFGPDAPDVLTPVLLDAYGLQPDEHDELQLWRAHWGLFDATSSLRAGRNAEADAKLRALDGIVTA